MDIIEFIMGVEDGSITKEDFLANVQSFVDTNIWRSLQGFWQREVQAWVDMGWCSINN